MNDRRRLSGAQKETLAGYLFISLWIAGFGVFIGWTMGYSLVLSFQKVDMLTPSEFVGLQNYKEVFHSFLTFKSLTNTFYYTFAGMPLRLGLALLVALALSRRLKGGAMFRSIFYLPYVIPPVAGAILWLWMYSYDFGIFNFLLRTVGLAPVPWFHSEMWAMPSIILMSVWWIGANMVIYLAGLQSIPTSFYEAAELDGANWWHKLTNITLPMLSPAILFTIVMEGIYSFQLFTEPYVMTKGGPNNATLTYVLHIYKAAFQQFRMGYASALAWVLFAIIFGITLSLFKSTPMWLYYEGEVKK